MEHFSNMHKTLGSISHRKEGGREGTGRKEEGRKGGRKKGRKVRGREGGREEARA
jgi:hypothetical protein